VRKLQEGRGKSNIQIIREWGLTVIFYKSFRAFDLVNMLKQELGETKTKKESALARLRKRENEKPRPRRSHAGRV